MRCPRLVHMMVTVMELTFRKLKKLKGETYFHLKNHGIFMVVGIQNSHFKVEQQTWVFHNGNTSSQKVQPGLNRHAIAVVDKYIFHYVVNDGKIHKYSIQYLEGIDKTD